MLDLIGAFGLGAVLVADLAVLVGLAALRPAEKGIAFAAASIWTIAIVAMATTGAFAPGVMGPIPAPPLVFAVLAIAGVAGWLWSERFRNALLSLPLAALVGVNAFRIGGVFFLIAHAQGRLAAPFALSAGWGDIITGIVAIPLAAMAAAKKPPPNWVLAVWNVFGALDLLAALTLALLSAPGTPFRLFMEPPGSELMTTFPWAGVATLLVPLYLLTHLTVAVRLSRSSRPR